MNQTYKNYYKEYNSKNPEKVNEWRRNYRAKKSSKSKEPKVCLKCSEPFFGGSNAKYCFNCKGY